MDTEEKIYFYELNGKLKEIKDLTDENLKQTLGMQVKVIYSDESEKVGYSCFNKDYLNDDSNDLIDNFQIWRFNNFNEEKPNDVYEQIFESISLIDVDKIIAILHSSPRFGTKPSNKFLLNVPRKNPSILLNNILKTYFGKEIKVKINNGTILKGVLDGFSRQEDNDDVCWSIDLQTDDGLIYLLDDEIKDIVQIDEDFLP